MIVHVAWQWQEHAQELQVEIMQGARVLDLLALINTMSIPTLSNALEKRAAIGVWGKALNVAEQAKMVLRENDRMELYWPLKADPKLARRQRVNAKKK